MTPHMIIIGLIVFFILMGGLYFFRINAGVKFINQLKPKPNLKDVTKWTIGPIIGDGSNSSQNMPPHPIAALSGMLIDMPTPQSQPHYVTINYGSLTGKSTITMNVTAEGGPFFAKDGTSQATICLYFQRIWDDWDATVSSPDGNNSNQNQDTQYYRWFATVTGARQLEAETFELTANLTDKWTALRAESLDSQTGDGAKMFKEAIDSAGEVGFVLGGGDGWGHGIMSPNPSKITVTNFIIT